ncbi:glycosyltransferase family 4 protein [Cohnella terricola]|uniref:Glycosyltransferase family 4 protein n=1 Tax=Cohnella terricola TaxID=1289167 RepID=A0A559JN00_9BACL|nr:glycosyltransferase family 4 protein [Cohnella terricola]TVY01252.1 glycosyltransferase family 4 protein [Cohnella terricola]
MKVWMWPKSSDFNAYNDLLSESLGDEGVEVRDLKHGKLMLGVGRARRGDIVHVHWMHHAYQGRNPAAFIVKSFIFTLTLIYLKLAGVRLVWTVHNLYPHATKYRRAERFMRTLICRFCHRLIVASESIKRKVMAEFDVPARKLIVVKHGHYVGVYKPKGLDCRRRYGIGEDADVYLFLGAIKAYKGVQNLVAAFNAIKTDRTFLIIAGKADQEMETYLRSIEDGANIVVDLRFIPDGEIADLMNAADALVMPYEEITTSGSAILGLSFRKPIVMPDNDFIDEYFRDGMVAKYDPCDKHGLAKAMKAVTDKINRPTATEYDRALKELNWNGIARKTKYAYEGRG